VTSGQTPVSAQRLLLAVGAAGLGLLALLLWIDGGALAVIPVLGLAAAVAGGEAIRVDLAFRQGGNASFTLGYASLAAGLLLLPGPTVVLAATAGITLWQIAERVPRFKFAVNVAQYLAGSGVAALAMEVIAPRPGPVDALTFAAAGVGIALFCAVNTITVGGMIAAFAERSWIATMLQLAPTSALLGGGSVGLGVLAVLLATDHPWALATLAVPLGLLHAASRREVQAQVHRERAVAFVDVEQLLANATDIEQVHDLLVDGARSILGCQAAIWRDDAWRSPVPRGSGQCPIDSATATPVVTSGPALGPAVDSTCIGVGLGNGVLVAWPGELALDSEAREWIQRLGDSGRVHGARSAAAGALRRERATLRAVVDGTADGIFLTDADGIVQLCNPAMAELAQVDRDAVIGGVAAELFGADDWTTEGVRDVARPGDRVWRLAVSSIQHKAHGELRIAVVHDVTTERRVARMKDDMLSIVSHELRTPLTPIKGSAQLLRRRWDRMPSEQREEMLLTIEQRADHLARLVEDLLLVGQLSSSKRAAPRVRPAQTDVMEVAGEAARQLRRLHRGHTIEVTGPESLQLTTDPLRVRQIIDNLVNNACKFSADGSVVRVDVTGDTSWVTLKIVDQGRGIPPEDLERVFERFERVEDPLNMTTSGAGLGLYIVKSLAEGLGGDVKMTSVLGRGTTATVRLPYPDPSAAGSTARQTLTEAVA
jgi:signal transduction histidine kinase